MMATKEINQVKSETEEARKKACKAYPQLLHCENGFVIIFNQVTELKKVSASKNLLKEALIGMNFTVKDYDNLKRKEALEKIEEAKNSDEMENYGCFVCVVVSHGKTNETNGEQQFWFGDQWVDLKELSQPLNNDNCLALAEKPKIFIIEACRGSLRDEKPADIPLGPFQEYDEEEDLNKSALGLFPVYQNFLYAFGTYKGYVAYGSWFVGALADCIKLYHKKETLLQILTRAIGVVAQRRCEREADDTPGVKYGIRLQTANYTSSLTSDIKFGQKPQIQPSGIQVHPSADEYEEPVQADQTHHLGTKESKEIKHEISNTDLVDEFSDIIQSLPKNKEEWNVAQIKYVLESVSKSILK